MANIKKSFNFRNGVQVDDDNFVINTNGLVGIGSTVPREFLDVRGNVIIDGLLTVNEISSDSLNIDTVNFTNVIVGITSITSGIITASSGIVTYFGDGKYLINVPTSQWINVNSGFGYTSIYAAGNVGVGTIFPFFTFQVGANPIVSKGVGISSSGNIHASGIITASSGFSGNVVGNINSTGVSTVSFLNSTNINASGIITATSGFSGNINSTGVSTVSFLNSTNINASGIITATSGFSGNINSTGVSTVSFLNSTNINASGIITASSGFSGNVVGNINSTGVSTVSFLNSTNINASGIITASSGFSGNVVGNINSTGVSTVSFLNSTNINASGIITATSGFSGNVVGNINSTGVSTVSFLNSTNINASGIVTASSFGGYGALVGTASSSTTTFVVTVASKTSNHRYFGTGSGSAYFIDGIESPFLTLLPGKTYRFTQEGVSNINHPILFYYRADKTTGYTTNVTSTGTPGSAGAYTEIVVTDTTPVVLHYQCSAHGYMGNAAHFSSSVVDTPYLITARSGINVTGVTTSSDGFIGKITGNINSTGVSTVSFLNSTNINASGIITATSGFSGNVIGNINSTGVSTVSFLNSTNINASGIITATSGFSGNVVGNINSTGVSTVSFLNSTNINASGIITATSGFSGNINSTGVSTVSFLNSTNIEVTTLSSGKVGIGTTIPTSELQIRKSGESLLEVISDTSSATISVGQAVGVGKSTAVFRFGVSGKTLDIINNDTGDINLYLHSGSSGIGTGRFNWIYGQTNDELMSLTYEGKLGIGKTNPNETFEVVGTSTVTSNAHFGDNVYVKNDIYFKTLKDGIVATNTNVTTGTSNFSTLYLYGGSNVLGIGTNIAGAYKFKIENNNPAYLGNNVAIGTTTVNDPADTSQSVLKSFGNSYLRSADIGTSVSINSGIVTANKGFTSGIGTAVVIYVIDNTIQFHVGTAFTSLKLY